MTVIQKWLSGLIGLGALYLVVSNPNGVYKGAQALNVAVGGTEGTILRGGR